MPEPLGAAASAIASRQHRDGVRCHCAQSKRDAGHAGRIRDSRCLKRRWSKATIRDRRALCSRPVARAAAGTLGVPLHGLGFNLGTVECTATCMTEREGQNHVQLGRMVCGALRFLHQNPMTLLIFKTLRGRLCYMAMLGDHLRMCRPLTKYHHGVPHKSVGRYPSGVHAPL
jgi:hypothetical protein